MTQDLNFNLLLPVSPSNTIDPAVHAELVIMYRAIRNLAEQVGGGDMIGWVDLSESASVVGWSSFTTKLIAARQLNIDSVLVTYFLAGTSNSSEVSFILSKAAEASCYAVPGLARDNGSLLTSPAQIVLLQDESIVNVYKDITGAAWTASGSKEIAGQFIYRI